MPGVLNAVEAEESSSGASGQPGRNTAKGDTGSVGLPQVQKGTVVRILGALLFLSGCAATVFSVTQAFSSGRPRDLLFSVLAPIAAIVAVLGLILAFVPGFFG